MKRCMTLLLALALALALIPCGAVAEGDFTLKIGVLSYLNLTEEVSHRDGSLDSYSINKLL